MASSVAFLQRARRSRAFMLGMFLLAVLILMAISADVFYPTDPLDIVGPPSLWPGANASFPLGTDMLGRDMAAIVFHGSRVSLTIGVFAAGIAILVGVLFGSLAGYCGGVVDDILMRITEFFQTIPGFLFAIVLVIIMRPSVQSTILAIGFTAWPQIARLMRAEVMRVRGSDYVLAAITMGRGHLATILDHILPNSAAPVIVATSVLVANSILMEASLSFLGLGDPNVASWGAMIGAGREVLRTAWYMSAVPGLAVFLTVMGFALIGNGLNDVLNPREVVR